jgi:hypothetical protein
MKRCPNASPDTIFIASSVKHRVGVAQRSTARDNKMREETKNTNSVKEPAFGGTKHIPNTQEKYVL